MHPSTVLDHRLGLLGPELSGFSSLWHTLGIHEQSLLIGYLPPLTPQIMVYYTTLALEVLSKKHLDRVIRSHSKPTAPNDFHLQNAADLNGQLRMLFSSWPV